MRQALTFAIASLCMVLAAPVRGDGPSSASEPPIITRARRLIRAGDRQNAISLLEDAVLDGPPADKPAVVDLLRQSYEAMAREAEAAGRAEVAAQYRDNLAILSRAHVKTEIAPARGPRFEPAKPGIEPAKPGIEPAKPRIESAPSLVRPVVPNRAQAPRVADPDAILPPSPGVEPPAVSIPPELHAPMSQSSLSEPGPLPEPAKLPMPQAVTPPSAAGTVSPTPVPQTGATLGLAADGASGAPMTRPIASAPDESNGREALINPGEAVGGDAAARIVANPAPAPSRNPALAKASGPANAAPTGSADLAAADQLFRAQRFDESGRVYAALAARNVLPADRRPHWAYCRFKGVVRRINAGPRSAREWDAIEAEVRNIQRLTPGNWYGDYLISKIAEARRSRKRRGGAAENVVVRGSSPDEPSPPLQAPVPAPERRRQGVIGRSGGTSAAPAAPAASPPPSPVGDRSLNLPGSLSLPEASSSDASDAGSRADVAASAPMTSVSSQSTPIASWQVRESPNFRIFHCDPELAERAAEVAESVRTAQSNRWGSAATRAPWSPRCDLYLYPTARSYAESTGQPEMSPGLSTMSSNGVRVLARHINLRADNPLLLTTTLPHEVTHIVLADLFVVQSIPRWADEGLAVLAEPDSELRHRQADLKGPLDAGRVFEAGRLMAMDYPDPKDWRLFYAQSVSLTQFLVEQGPPERFIRFVRDCQRVGTETALRDVYQIEGLAALQERWLDYAREQAALDVASRPASDTAADNAGRH